MTSSKSIGLYTTQRYRTNKSGHGDAKKNTVTDVSDLRTQTMDAKDNNEGSVDVTERNWEMK